MTFSVRMSRIKASGIRAVQKRIAGKEGMISFAAGLPDPELYPLEDLRKAADTMLEKEGAKAFAYGLTKGYGPLLDFLTDRMNNREGVECTKENICMLSGSQQGLGMAAMMFIDEGDVVITENPSYLGAINAFRPYGAEFKGVDTDDDGIVIEDLEKVLAETPKAKLIYVIPNFQNPTGKAWSLERREKFMEVVSKYDVVVVEDNPYGDLRFKGEQLPHLRALDKKGQVMYLGSFSKILSPGMRVAWACASPEVAKAIEELKETNDLQSPELTQMLTYYYLSMFDLEEHIREIQVVYKERCELMVEMIKEHFPPEIKYTDPEGGMFLWLELPEGLDSDKILDDAVAAGIAYIPGESFFSFEGVTNTIRMNFTMVKDEQIREGIRILGDVFKKYI
ncbi:MAG: PLP-dependent aminotransferase family protein [Clostridiales bacterium]|nr:PLP-dependent aminotransferase family protein [Candidatus Crickella merdequi]